MDLGRRHASLGSETKSRLLLKAIVVARVSASVLVPQAPTPTGQRRAVRETSTYALGSIKEKEAWTYRTWIFLMGSKHACLFSPEVDTTAILQDYKQICPCSLPRLLSI